jgi:hypothetical protein
VTGDAANSEIVRVYNVDKGVDFSEYIPAKLEVSPDGDGYFLGYESRPGPGYTIVSFRWSSRPDNPGASFAARVDGELSYSLGINDVELPLEKHPSYRTKWNFDLWGNSSTGSAPSAPSWWSTAASRSDADGVTWHWSKDRPPDPGDGSRWFLVKPRTKDGVEGYLVVQPVVSARKYCKKLSDAEAFLRTSVARAVPGETFGFASATKNWLASPVGIDNDGEYWVAENRYQFADEWDSDLYA